MKNTHVLPTDKPSRLWINTITGKLVLDEEPNTLHSQHIYITSDEEITGFENYIWVYNNGRVWLWQNTMALRSDNKPRKIILTTDQDLINNGIEQISEDTLLKIVEHINSGKNIIKNNIVTITLWKWLETKNLIKQILNTYEKFIQNRR